MRDVSSRAAAISSRPWSIASSGRLKTRLRRDVSGTSFRHGHDTPRTSWRLQAGWAWRPSARAAIPPLRQRLACYGVGRATVDPGNGPVERAFDRFIGRLKAANLTRDARFVMLALMPSSRTE